LVWFGLGFGLFVLNLVVDQCECENVGLRTDLLIWRANRRQEVLISLIILRLCFLTCCLFYILMRYFPRVTCSFKSRMASLVWSVRGISTAVLPRAKSSFVIQGQ
jgi:hypothetical protein